MSRSIFIIKDTIRKVIPAVGKARLLPFNFPPTLLTHYNIYLHRMECRPSKSFVMLGQASPKILILECQMLIAADVSLQLLQLGYEVIGIHTCSEDLFKTIAINRPDLVLMNIDREYKEERFKTAAKLSKNLQIPIIFLSAHSDQEIFKQIIKAQAYAFIPKPFETSDLQRGLKTAFDRINAVHKKLDIHDP